MFHWTKFPRTYYDASRRIEICQQILTYIYGQHLADKYFHKCTVDFPQLELSLEIGICSSGRMFELSGNISIGNLNELN